MNMIDRMKQDEMLFFNLVDPVNPVQIPTVLFLSSATIHVSHHPTCQYYKTSKKQIADYAPANVYL